MEIFPATSVSVFLGQLQQAITDNAEIIVIVIGFFIAVSFVMAWWDTTHETITWRGKKY